MIPCTPSTVRIIKVTACLLIFLSKAVVALDFRAEHSIPTESFQAHFDQTTNDGFRLVSITGFDDADGNIFFNTIWHRNTASIAWRGYAGIPQNDYQAILDENIAQGFRPIFVDGFSANGIPYICAIYHLEDNPPFWSSRDLQSSSEYQQYYENMLSQGYSLDVISSYQVYGSLRIVSLFSQHTANDSDDWVARHGLTASEYEAAFDQFVGQGYSLEHVSAGTIDNDEPRFATIFSRGPSNENGQFVAFRGIAEADIQTSLDTWISKGYVPKVIDCYRSGNDLRWALLLTKNPEPPVEPEANDASFSETTCFDEKIVSFMKENGIPGAGVSVMKDGRIVYSQGYGTRDVPGIGDDNASPRKVSECTPFRLASISKSVTSLAILRLAQNGDLSLSDKVFGPGGILKQLSENPKTCCPIVDDRIFDITVYHLLTHSGGWDRDITFDPMFQSKTISSVLGITGPASCESVIYYMFGQFLQYRPGTTYAYSNFGYCVLGRIIEETTGLDYEEAVRLFLLDPAGISREEMYVGSTRLEDIPEIESEYYCSGCSGTESVFPTETSRVPNPYGAWYLEAMDSHGGWVASAPQLMRLLSTTAAPHCNGTIANRNTEMCLLWDTSIDSLTATPPFSRFNSVWYGLGFSVRNAGTDHNWWHTGSLPGAETILVRTNAGYGYAWAMLLNTRGFSGSIDTLMWEAVGCVGDSWPQEYETTCDRSDNPPTAPPFSAPAVGVPPLSDSPTTALSDGPVNATPVSNSPTTSPSNAPLPISIGPSTPPSNAPASSSPTTSPSDYRVAASNWPSSQPFADPVETPATARPTTATSDDKIHDMKPLSSPPTVSPLGDLQSGAGEAGGSSTQSKCRMYVAILVLSLTAFLLL